MTDWRQNRIQSAINGTNPMVLAELSGGYAVLGDTQFLPGYCVLLPKMEVNSLNDLPLEERTHFLRDMTILGDAVITVCDPLRVNYDILGNTDHFLHAHVFPRYDTEPGDLLQKPVWLYSPNHWTDERYAYNATKHGALKQKLMRILNQEKV